MKKGFSLIELVFSIVIIGICLASLPRIVEVSLKSDEMAFKQEFFYELKEFYGVIKNLPISANNVCKENSKNSLLSQYCAFDTVGYGAVPRLELVRVTPRHNDDRIPGCANCTTIDGLNIISSKIDIIYPLESSNTYYDPLERFDFTNIKIEDSKKTIELDSGIKRAINTKASKISIFDKEDNEVLASFNVFFPKFGRTDSIYTQYTLRTDDKAWDDKINNKDLDMFLNFK